MLFSRSKEMPVQFATKFLGSAAATTTQPTPLSSNREEQGRLPLRRSEQGSMVVYKTQPAGKGREEDCFIFMRQHSSACVFPGSSLEKPLLNNWPSWQSTAPTQ